MGSVTTVPHAGTSAVTLSALYGVSHGPLPRGPARVGRYLIRDTLGAGAMGVVYRAHDPDLGRDVAIKLVRGEAAHPSSHVRLLREAQAMAKLHHPNVVPIFDVGQAGDAVFVAMPLLEGGTLKHWLRSDARPFDAILDRFLAAGRGLAAAHAAGLVHRDFKPDNVLLGIGGEIHVADFGLARRVGDEPGPEGSVDPLTPAAVTQTGAVLGTPAYMAPEQLRGRLIDARADQFSFCVALWEGIYGQRPFPDPSGEAGPPWHSRLDAIAAGPALPRRDRRAWIARLLVRGLATDPKRRWPTLQALLDAIAARRRPRRWPRRLAMATGLGLVVAAVLTRPTPDAQLAASLARPPALAQLTPLARYDNLQAVAISSAGNRLAFITGDALVVEDLGARSLDRTVVDHGVEPPIAWSPDGRRLLVGAVPAHASQPRIALIDVDSNAQRSLPGADAASFLSDGEIALASYRQRVVSVYRLDEPTHPVRTCLVPGDYTFLWKIAGLPDGTIVAETLTLDTGRHRLVILGRDCGPRATFWHDSVSSFALTDTGTVVALSAHDGSNDLLEISLDAAIVSRRRVAEALDEVIGRRHGIDYVTTLAPRTALVQLHDGAAHAVWSSESNAPVYVAPDGDALAWIARDGRAPTPRPLWLSSLSRPSGARVVVERALSAGWSPNGQRLAVLVDDTPTKRLEVTDRIGAVITRIPLDDADPEAAPVWLDDDRIAVRTGDRITYRGFDVVTGDQGEILDRRHGSTLWLTRSPRDGTLAMFRMGSPDRGAGAAEHLWIQPPGGEPRPLHVDSIKHFLVPSWTRSGELLVRALQTGEVWRVALDTGTLTPIAQLPSTPLGLLFDDHLVVPPGGDLIAIDRELGANIARVRLDDAPAEPTVP
ncbi:MAG TPA: protein kinase [Kofleriaceae bacterium]|jgi:hypothetical protein|nr:protein kinase [Kofleriaceae bacterium]